MCLIFCAFHEHPRYPLIVVANRDEFYERPSLPLAFHADYPEVLMGRDVTAGGTWQGLALSGRFAALTNLAGAKIPPGAKSRGELPIGWLTGTGTQQDYVNEVAASGERYQGFNLFAADLERLWFVSNDGSGTRELPAGLHGLANRGLDDDSPKVACGKALLAELLRADEPDQEAIITMLGNPKPLTKINPSATLSERAQSSLFVAGCGGYGTRVSSLLMVDDTGRYTFTERQWPVGGARAALRQFAGYLHAA